MLPIITTLGNQEKSVVLGKPEDYPRTAIYSWVLSTALFTHHRMEPFQTEPYRHFPKLPILLEVTFLTDSCMKRYIEK